MMMFGSCSGSNQSLARFLLAFPGVVHLLLQLPVLVLLPLHFRHNVVHLGLLRVDLVLQSGPLLLLFPQSGQLLQLPGHVLPPGLLLLSPLVGMHLVLI